MTKVVILAGGLGSRMMEETTVRPKPMVEIGGMPILWHIMKFYASFGLKDFIICAGYKQHMIKEFFFNYSMNTSDVTFDMSTGSMTRHGGQKDDWKVTVVDTGENTLTGGRLKRVGKYLGNEPFCLTYGDGLTDVDVPALIAHHKKMGKLATLTAIYTPPRFGELDIENGKINRFMEKMTKSESRINGGYMVLDPRVLDYIAGDDVMLEFDPLRKIASEGQLVAYEHDGFWQCMDNVRERQLLENTWNSGKAPWKKWA
jgi:glucose-1-phosphate cytidylyltransferase